MKQRTVGIIGLGLIGGSFARICKAAGMRVLAVDCCKDTRHAALSAAVVDEVFVDAAAVAMADEIFIAVPVGAFADIFAALADSLSPTAVIFDGGSCKAQAAALAMKYLGNKANQFVPSHPIAGGEDSGFAASSADLFVGHWAVLCPENSAQSAVEIATAAWQRTGATVARMSIAEHDEMFAAVSHLPHLLSFALVESIRACPNNAAMLRYAAGGFRDFTRIAGSHPIMWRDICLHNRGELLAATARFRQELDTLESAIRDNCGAVLEEKFAAARDLRRQWREVLEK